MDEEKISAKKFISETSLTFTKPHKTLAFRLFIYLIILFIIIFSITTYFLIEREETKIYNIVESNITRTGDIIKRSTHYSMLLNRKEDVQQIIKTIGNEPGFEIINVYNKRGEISFSSKENFIGKMVDMHSAECSPCHSISNLKMYLTTKERIRVFNSSKGGRIIGLIIPIENEKDCTTSECHAHEPETKILGVIDIQMSLHSIDQIIHKSKKGLVLSAGLITLIISAFSGLFIWLVVHKRVRLLIQGTKEISKGNYDFKIPLKSDDELGELAISFNNMTENLKKALEEIKDLNKNLNIKVKEKTEQLKQIYNHVTQIERIASLGKLSATVAHELNNPLEGILTYSKLIIKKLNNSLNDDEKSKIIKYLELIAAESERCGNIVKNLLLFSRTTETNFVMNDLISILERSILLINHHLKLNNIKLEKDFCCSYLQFECDKNQIQQAIIAVLMNAVESMPDGGTIKIKAKCVNQTIFIIIEDTGIGISKENLDKIFEPFFTTKSSGKGTGLGLSVTYGIVKQHNGSIKVESEVGKGTKIILTFPLKRSAEMIE